MKNKLRKKEIRIVAMLTAFVVLLTLVGFLMYSKLETLLNNYVEKQVAEEAAVLASLANENMNSELKNLENIASYIESENENIDLTLKPVGISDTRKNITYDFYDIQQNNEGTTYYIEVELEPKTENWIRLDIAWDENDENHKLYQGQIGEVVYTSRVEQVVD